MKSKRTIILILVGVIVGGLLLVRWLIRPVVVPVVMPGAETKQSVTANVRVFEDLDGDGEWDGGERPLPNTLTVASANIHGTFTQSSTFTDADGKAAISATYTHFFDVGAVTPCGYKPTTPESLSVAEAGLFTKFQFGFQPESESSATSTKTLDFHLWHDWNRDGRYQDNEPPLPNVEIAFAPRLDFISSVATYDVNGLTAVTDDTGHAILNVGNACGTLFAVARNQWDTTSFEPNGIVQENGEIEFNYGDQITMLNWAVAKYHYFSFVTGGAYHPEGFGEWRINFNTTGALTIRHQVGDETTDYGTVTLPEAENQATWALIAAANIEALPENFQRPGLPDETAYTFSLHAPDQVYMRSVWVDDARQDPALQALVSHLIHLIEQYTGTTSPGG